MTIAQFITAVRYLINEATASKWFDSELLTNAYGIICDDYFAKLLAANNQFYDWYVDLSVVSGTQTYDLPYRIIKEILRDRIEKLDSDGLNDYNFYLIEPQEVANLRSSAVCYLSAGGQSLTFSSLPSETMTVRVWFKRLPWEFHYSNPAADTTAIGLTMKLDQSPTLTVYDAIRLDDDYYNGAFIYIASGNGVGLKKRITDYSFDGTDSLATVDSAWGTKFPLTTSVYEIPIPLPEEYHSLLVLDTAIMARQKFDESVSGLQRRRDMMYQTFFSQAGERLGYRTFAED